jgi:acetyltransferase-like isoleucine patch superfamily enzyme
MKKLVQFYLVKLGYFILLKISPDILKRLNLRFNQNYSIRMVHEFKNKSINVFFQYSLYLLYGKYISIGDNFNCGLRFRLEAYAIHLGHEFNPKITIGNNVSINHNCHITAIN